MDTHRKDTAESSTRPGSTAVDTLVIGGGQAGLATSYWLSHTGIEHRVLERRSTLGGAWQDCWDAFCLNTPNFSIQLPGMPYAGPDPDAFMVRQDIVEHLRRYARLIGSPVDTDTDVVRVAAAERGFAVETSKGAYLARNVVLATGAYQKPKIPEAAGSIPSGVQQLHTHQYRNPGQLSDGAVLIVGTGQSGGQIAEELHAAGREVHLAVSSCPEAPRRYRGRDLFHWLTQIRMHGAEYGVPPPRVEQLPSPAARFACNPLVSGADGGHDIHLRELGRQGVRLHGHLEAVQGDELVFTDDLAERLTAVESGFGERMQPPIDAYIAAAGIDAPAHEARPSDDWMPPESTRLAAAGIGSIIWATGFRPDFSFLEIPVLDEWRYPRQARGVTEYEGLYAVGLPWLTDQASALLAGVGRDAAYVAQHIAARQATASAAEHAG